ncbi:TetR/AcrR family transcriptional regulator [Phormidium tenue FACHB-886]|nr:TetR/AcrR family transcriptional regulator [Phormidium tenue FACHB-886]
MNRKANQNSSKETVLDVAEQLFVVRGYTVVTLKQLADQLGIKQASLYYHFPLGKEELYVEVMLRHLEHRRAMLERLISQAQPNLRDCLLEVGVWLIQQLPLHADRMIVSDLPELSADKAAQLEEAIYRCAFAPIEGIFIQYRHRLKPQFQSDLGFIAGSFLCYLESLYTFKRYGSKTERELVSDLVDLLFEGSVVT